MSDLIFEDLFSSSVVVVRDVDCFIVESLFGVGNQRGVFARNIFDDLQTIEFAEKFKHGIQAHFRAACQGLLLNAYVVVE